jgi:hypothetical protein
MVLVALAITSWSALGVGSAAAQPAIHPAFADAVAQVAGSAFPGPILVPSTSATFFDPLLTRQNPASQGDTGTDGWRAPGVPMYELRVGVLGGDAPLVIVDGYAGRSAFVATFTRGINEEECDPAAPYCAYTPFIAGPPTEELIDGLVVGGQPAAARHQTCCNGETWAVGWYDARADVSYSLTLSFSMADQLGARGVDADHVAAAQRLADVATALVAAP